MELPVTWTLIAESGPRGFGRSQWIDVPGACLSSGEAIRMNHEGVLLMAQQRLSSGNMGLLIKAPQGKKR